MKSGACFPLVRIRRLKNILKTLSEKRVEKKSSTSPLRSSKKQVAKHPSPAIPVYHNCSFTGDRPQFCMLLFHRIHRERLRPTVSFDVAPIFGEKVTRVTILMDQLKIPLPPCPSIHRFESEIGPPIISSTRSSSSRALIHGRRKWKGARGEKRDASGSR